MAVCNTSELRPGGRAAKVVAAIRLALFELLAEKGYDGFEIPDIALRAGVNRTTIYRRWPSKADLVLAFLLEEMRARVPTPDTGSFQTDLAEMLASIATVLTDPVIRSVFHILSSRSDKQTIGARATFWEQRLTISGEIVSRAIARGELPDGVSPRAVLELGAAPLFYRILVLGVPMDTLMIHNLAEWVARQDLKSFPATVR